VSDRSFHAPWGLTKKLRCDGRHQATQNDLPTFPCQPGGRQAQELCSANPAMSIVQEG